MSILALDLGTKTGWAFGKSTAAHMSGTWDLKPRRYDGGGMRFVKFKGELNDILKAGRPEMVVFEEVRKHNGTDAAHVYGGLLAVLTAWCEELEIPYRGVTVQAIKKHITGRGNAGKPDVIAAVQKLGFEPEDDNHADALALFDGVMRGVL